jgi:hypothetical protein
MKAYGGAELLLHSFLTSALDEGEKLNWSAVRIQRDAGCTSQPSWRLLRKDKGFLHLPGVDRLIVQPVTSRYTDYAVLTSLLFKM